MITANSAGKLVKPEVARGIMDRIGEEKIESTRYVIKPRIVSIVTVPFSVTEIYGGNSRERVVVLHK